MQACWSLPLLAEERRRAYRHPAKRRRGKRWSCGGPLIGKSSKTAIRFEDAGITICAEENEEHLSYTRIKCAFELLHLWLVVCDDECALLLQKKGLRSGNADSFLSDIISKMNTGTDAFG